MHYCPHCHKPIWDMLSCNESTIIAQLDAFCQCPRLTIYLSEYVYEAAKSLSRQLTSTNGNLHHCARCGWFCNLAYHSGEECDEYLAWNGMPTRTPVAPPFYDKLSDEEVSL